MSELRRDAITGRYVIIAPERRLSRDAFRRPAPVAAVDGDMCPFCEGQEAAAGREILAWRTPGTANDTPGWQVRVVANREPALRIESHLGDASESLFQWFGGLGAHEVIVESPDHHATLATMAREQVERVLWAWRERVRDLRRDFRFESFLIVKNFGAQAGATLDHPHSQLLAMPLVPQHLEDELSGARSYFERRGRCVFCDLAEQEALTHTRVVASDDLAIAFAPFAARVPFETWIVAREHCGPLEAVSDAALYAVAERLRDVMRRLDRVLLSPAYTLLLHAAPVEGAQPVAIEPRRDLLAPPQAPDVDPSDSALGTSDAALRTSDAALRTSDSSLRTSDSEPGTSHSEPSTSHSALRTSHSYFHWHIEVIPRLLPLPGLAWDGGIHINPVPPEEAAQALRDAKP